LGVQPGDDPPDRELTSGSEAWALELTELTAQDVRQDLAQARSVGRRLATALCDDRRFTHLHGRKVVVSYTPVEGPLLAKDVASTIDALLEMLVEDKGCVGDGVVGLPARWANSNGFYPRTGRSASRSNAAGSMVRSVWSHQPKLTSDAARPASF
jgi:hypothetical protein